MKREIIETKNVKFIGCWKIENENLFQNIIDFFEKNRNLQKYFLLKKIDFNLLFGTFKKVIEPLIF